ncbi:uncharacterized protein EAE97_009444 [Botrytis byssoidea]|uniref:Uncharacterized protein n=1 Tax=Botrytis byssoidea TaxID=139641 RepID=A0A9P5LQM4_9HELO|nr:uncharacterized protein EAE97_009444 [Botrytis byssoidea]KAF7929847.1 hypothetical protein EAE97_009444 [Botrytis byssoidea]
MFEEVSAIAEVLAAPLEDTVPLEDAIIEDATFEDRALEDPIFEVVPETSEDRGILELNVADWDSKEDCKVLDKTPEELALADADADADSD